MRPLKLSIKGFGAFRERTHIDLTDIDLVALVGPTGSGKSTIIDAITFALYGTVARYEDNRLVAPVINQTSSEAQVSLDFALNDQAYTAVRVVRRTGSGATTKEARLERGESVLASDAKAMSIEVEKLLGLGVDQFNRTVVLPQGKFAAFLHDKPGKRQVTLVQLLGLGLYQRIGQQARRRSAVARNQVDALAPEYDQNAEQLTDERRSGLKERIKKAGDAIARMKADRETVEALDEKIAALTNRIQSLDDQTRQMSMITRPPGLTTLADQIAAAIAAATNAEALHNQLAEQRRAAETAQEGGPDLVAVELQLNKHRELSRIKLEYEGIVPEHKQSVHQHEGACAEASRLEEIQERLDAKVEESRRAADDARAVRDRSAPLSQIKAWEAAHGRYREAVEQAEDAEGKVQAAQQAMPPLRRILESAEAAAREAAAGLETLRRHAGVLGHVDLLEVGANCPLCLQQVPQLPDHAFDDADLHLAEESKRLADTCRAKAHEAYEEAGARLKGRRAQAQSALRSVEQHRSQIDSIPAGEQLPGLRDEATRTAEEVRVAEEAIRQAETAARHHRQSPTYTGAMQNLKKAFEQMTRIEAERAALSQQLAGLSNEVAAFAPQDRLHSQKEEAIRLQRELRKANARLRDAEDRHKAAGARVAEMEERRRRSTNALHAARDGVARFAPPVVDTSDLVAAWTSLTDWARQQMESGEAECRAAIEQKTAAEERRARLVGSLRALCEDLLGPIAPGSTVEDLGILLAQDLAVAKAELKQFDKDRSDLEKLKERIEGLNEQAEVARQLGAFLRADGFEGWLMEAALQQLVERATERLYELSNGQYSLQVHKRDFFVRDHANADELRSARTLSGGETFLASLSLSLALAEMTEDLSTGMVSMESIFLDEGFGTLDSDTLDTVAAAVEELGAGGKLVGIVTHIRELADRMPVRLELTKTGGASTVERIDH